MNRRNHYLLAAALFAMGCGVAGERHHDTITRNWPAAGIKTIDIHEVDGSVNVTAGAANEISLVADVRERGVEPDPKKDNKGYFESTVDGDTLSIGRRGERRMHIPFLFSRNDISIDYTLRVPQSIALNVKTVNGRVATRGTNGEVRVVTVNGSVDLEAGGEQEVSAHTVNGRVKARFIDSFQGASLKTVNGSVDAMLPKSASFACDLSQVNGDFEASFPLSIHSHPGSRRVSGEVNGGRYDLRIVTVNGDIRLDMSAPPTPPAAPASPTSPTPPSASAPQAPSAPAALPAPPGPVT
jgi:putative adhesin